MLANRVLTEPVLLQIMPKCSNAGGWIEPLSKAMNVFEINTPHRMAAFLAQIAHESADLQHLVENLNYSAERLMQVWPKRFPTMDAATPFARAPEKLANRVYSKRLGNGSEESGDGWGFRGRGVVQLTGRLNYRQAGAAIQMPLETQPELLEQPPAAALSAAWYWNSHGCNALSEDHSGTEDEDFTKITIKINGATGALEQRRIIWKRAQAAFGIT